MVVQLEVIYITDVITALFTILFNGKNSESYNVSNEKSIMSIINLSQLISKKFKYTNVVININESNKYPTNKNNWPLCCNKIYSLGWSPLINIDEMFSLLISSFYYQTFNNNINKHKNKFKYYLKKIFSLTSENSYKIISIFGIKIKINRAKLYNKLYYNKKLKNKIVFNNFYGMGYGCNPKYIAKEIIKRNLPYELVWLCNDMSNEKSWFPSRIRPVYYSKSNVFKELSDAKIYIANVRTTDFIKFGWEKKPNQFYIQTWHGSLGIKRIGDQVIPSSKNYTWIEYAKKDSLYTNVIIGNSNFDEKIFHNSFWYTGKIKKFGHPRNDIFFYSDKDKYKNKENIYKYFNISKDTNIVLYAPSFRDDGRIDVFTIDPEMVLQALKQRFSGKWIFAIRMHPRLKYLSNILFDFRNNNIVDVSNYPDIYELMSACELMITDYSSCIYEFIVSRKPGFIFATDIDMYNNQRGFYYPLSSTPFLIADSNEKLVDNILQFDNEIYKNKLESFLNEKGCIEDGHASERVVDMIENIMGKEYE